MSGYAPESIRNIAFVGHSGSGKTSLAEAVLFSAGVTSRLGTVDEGNTRSDFTESEISRKISISTSMLHCDWKSTKINILDAPGYTDFIADSKAAIWAVDSAVFMVHSVNGVEIGTDKAWVFSEDYGRPSLFFVNHMDKEFADFDGVLQEIQDRYGKGAISIQIPVNPGEGFNQIVDIFKMKLLAFPIDGSGKAEISDIPLELQEHAEIIREQLIEAAAESDDELTEKYLEHGELSEKEIHQGLKIGIRNRTLFPVLCGNVAGNIGVSLLLDFLVSGMPAPSEVELPEDPNADSQDVKKSAISPEGQPAAIVFKTISETVGDLSFLRVYSGSLRPGDDVFNASLKTNERIGQIYSLNGRDRDEMQVLGAGDIGALIKLKDTHTGNIICAKNSPVALPPLEFPHPLIRIALEPKSRGDEERISSGLQRIHEEDPSFISGYDPELRQIIVEGQGELHLDVVLQKLREKFGVEVDTVEPRIPYREAITSKAEAHHRHKKQTGGRGQFGEVYLRVEPRGRGEGYEFGDEIVGGAIPSKYIPAVEKGVSEAMERGVHAGYRVVDTRVTVFDGSFHAVDSSDMAFKLAGSQAFQKAFLNARPILLEPIYKVEVTVPDKYMGDVMGDLNGRRGRIQGMDPEGNFQIIRAEVPLSELYKYSTLLRSMTQGTGDYTMSFSHFEPVPQDLTKKIVEAGKEKKEAVEA